MSFKQIEVVVASAVASAGTITFTYPTGLTAGSFAGAHAHKMWVDKHQKMYSCPNDFTVAFGAASAVVTYNGSTTIPAGARCRAQFDVLGSDDREPEKAAANAQVIKGNLHLLDLGAPATADADGVAASQTVTGAGTAFVLNGALVQNGVAYFDTPRNVVAAWTNTAVLTITGKDVDGNTVVEKSASGTSHTGKKAFKSVSSVTTSATVTSATVGTGVVVGMPVYVPDASYVIAELKNGVALPRRPGVVAISGVITEAQLDAATSIFVTSPVAGAVRKLTTVSQGDWTTGGTLTVEIGGTAVDGLGVVIANSAAAGDIDSDIATLGHASTAVAAGGAIEIVGDGAINASADLHFVLEIDTTAAGQLTGTFVAGVTSKATATTGDTRGTYSPLTTPDGTNGYQLLVALPDPGDVGVPQYTG